MTPLTAPQGLPLAVSARGLAVAARVKRGTAPVDPLLRWLEPLSPQARRLCRRLDHILGTRRCTTPIRQRDWNWVMAASPSAELFEASCELLPKLRQWIPDSIIEAEREGPERERIGFWLLTAWTGFRREIRRSVYVAMKHSPTGITTTRYVNGSTGHDTNFDGTSPTVDGGGVGPWATIEKFNTSCSNGWKCVIANGTYTDVISPGGKDAIVGGGVVSGTSSHWIVYEGASTNGVILTGISGKATLRLSWHSYVHVKNVWARTIDYLTVGADYGALFDETPPTGADCHHLLFENVRSESSMAGQGCNNIQLWNCRIQMHSIIGNAGECVSLLNPQTAPAYSVCHDILYYSCIFRDAGHACTQAIGAPAARMTAIYMAFCDISSALAAGASAIFVDSSYYECNDIHHTATNGSSSRAASQEGMFLCGGSGGGNIAQYNRTWRTWGPAYFLQTNDTYGGQDCTGNIYRHNFIWSSYGQPFQFIFISTDAFDAASAANQIVNNIAWNCHYGMGGTYDGLTAGANDDFFAGYREGGDTNVYFFTLLFGYGTLTNANQQDDWGLTSHVTADRTINATVIKGNCVGHATLTITFLQYAATNLGGTTTYTEAQAKTQFNTGGNTYINGNVFNQDPLVYDDPSISDTTGLAVDVFGALKANSPAIDAGIDSDGYGTGSNPDSGCYEGTTSVTHNYRKVVLH